MKKAYYWWNGSDMAEFFAAVQARGLDNVRIEFHPNEGMLFVKPASDGVAAQGNGADGYNYVHTCPPECP